MLPAKITLPFVAEFSDGTKYYQNLSDVSREHPLTRSCFWDVQSLIEQGKQLAKFTLRNAEHEFIVFLAPAVHGGLHYNAGDFRWNGTAISSPYQGLKNFRVIYFRRCQVQQNELVDGQVREIERRRPEIISYFLGWQANDILFNNQQMVLEVNPAKLCHPPLI